ncbi:MAG: hypothetical protein IKG47_12420 [Oscillospiraceae bacterium]|nr:hypothetical protein [Oscillospiraceae bacterium]
MKQKELNRLLYEASKASRVDLEIVEKLLKQGGDPLGYYDEDEECALGEVFINSQELKSARCLPGLVDLFIRYGMDVDSSEDDLLHYLTWVRNEYGVKALQLLMDAGLSNEYAEEFAEDLIGHILMFEASYYRFSENRSYTDYRKSLDNAVKMVLLLASYERVFNHSKYIRYVMSAEEVDYAECAIFRNWADYYCDVIFQDFGDLYPNKNGNEISWFLGAATIYEKNTRKEVRKLRLVGDLDMEILEKVIISDERSIWK